MTNYTIGTVLSILEDSINNPNPYRVRIIDVAMRSSAKLNRFIHIELNENDNRISIEGIEVNYKIENQKVVRIK